MVYKHAMKGFLRTVLLFAAASVLLLYQLLSLIASPEMQYQLQVLLPESVKRAVGISDWITEQNAVSLLFGTASGICLLVCIFFLFSGGGIVYKHQERGLLEFYLTRSVTRRAYFMCLWLRGLTYAIVMSVLFAGSIYTYLYVSGSSPYAVLHSGSGYYAPPEHLWLALRIAFRCFVVWLTLYSVGLCFGAICKHITKPRFFALLVFLVLYVCGILCELFSQLWFFSFGALYHTALPLNAVYTDFLIAWQILPLTAVLLIGSIWGGIAAMHRRDIEEIEA